MANVKFTKNQLKAIGSEKGDILVSAAAGSGKTAVLVERIIRIITDNEKPVDVDRLLVLTFTEAAAGEMRQRILEAIQKKIEKQPDNDHLRRQEVLINKANITTIHSFCLGVVRKYFYLAEVSPNFRIMDSTEAGLIKQETCMELFEELYIEDNKELFAEVFGEKNNERFLKFIECYGDKVKDDKAQELVLNLHEFISGNPFPEQWLRDNYEKLDSRKGIENSDWYDYFIKQISLVVEGCYSAIDILRELCDKECVNPDSLNALDSDEEIVKNIEAAMNNGFHELYDSFQYKFSMLKLTVKRGEEVSDEVENYRETIKNIREKYIKSPLKNIKDKALFSTPMETIENIEATYDNVKTLSQVTIAFMDRYYKIKREKNIADFSDLEHLCLKVLIQKNNEKMILTDAAKELRDGFYEVLTDEYQDSNLIQEIILSTVSKKEPYRNRFMVGDIKQSIYKFRMANPELFMEKYENYSSEEGAEEYKIDLSKNFRSRKNILAVVNFIFAQIMSKELGEVEYDKNAMLYYGADYEEISPEHDATELIIVDSGKENDFNEWESEENFEVLLKELSAAETEAKIAADKIKGLFGGNKEKAIFQVTDKNGLRNLEYRDIAILFRSTKTYSESFEREFKKQGIPIFCDSSQGYFESVEIRTMLAFLNIIDNPRQDIDLGAVLYSPLFSFDVDELTAIRRSLAGGMFFDAIVFYKEYGEDKEIKDKAINFLEQLKYYREYSVSYTISQLIWEIYQKTGYMEIVSVMAGGKQKKANLTVLYERAVSFENTDQKSLFRFVRYIEKLQKRGQQLGYANVTSQNADVVRLMSIHKSKGLEFPVVFVCGLGKKFNLRDSSSEFLFHQYLGLGTKAVDLEKRVKYDTLNRYVIGSQIRNESISEEMRILYVALTRAKEKLFLIGHSKNIAKTEETLGLIGNEIGIPFHVLNTKSSYMDWIITAVLRHKRAEGILIEDGAEQIFVPELYNSSSIWNIQVMDESQFYEEIETTTDKKEAIKEKLEQIQKTGHKDISDEMKEILSYSYPYEEETSIPSKISISEIKRMRYELLLKESETYTEKDYTKITLKKPDFIEKDRESTSLKRGLAIHALLERIDFKKIKDRKDIGKLINQLEKTDVLSKEDTELIDIDKIERFLQSDLSKRIKKSEKIYKEVPFVHSISAGTIRPEWKDTEMVLVHGIIDLFFYEGDEVVLVDYKSDRISKKYLEDTVGHYKTQLSIYKEAIESALNVKVKEAVIYFLELGEEYVMGM